MRISFLLAIVAGLLLAATMLTATAIAIARAAGIVSRALIGLTSPAMMNLPVRLHPRQTNRPGSTKRPKPENAATAGQIGRAPNPKFACPCGKSGANFGFKGHANIYLLGSL